MVRACSRRSDGRSRTLILGCSAAAAVVAESASAHVMAASLFLRDTGYLRSVRPVGGLRLEYVGVVGRAASRASGARVRSAEAAPCERGRLPGEPTFVCDG